MLRIIVFAVFLCSFLSMSSRAAEPAATAWIVHPQAGAAGGALARVLPEVQSVRTTEREIEVRSSGVSLHFFGMLQTPPAGIERGRQWRFRIPRRPMPAQGAHARVRPDAVGVFVNGVPIFNPFEGESYQGRNLWHFDPIAGGDDGAAVAGGRARAELPHGGALGLLESLIADGSRHSPIIGYAFDGYPIYGPWATAKADGSGGLRRMRSSYRLRKITARTAWPDGTALTPEQVGPPVDETHPLGSVVEDYEFAPGAGDLDEFNGRFALTPEYPNGTYAYFLTTDAQGRLAFPYLLAGRYFGEMAGEALTEALRDEAAAETPTLPGPFRKASGGSAALALESSALAANAPVRLRFQARRADGAPIRFLENVHERPLHLLIVSEDLAEFDHIHPELTADDRFEVVHRFRHGGRYRLYADFTPPGEAQRVEVFDLTIAGAPRPRTALSPDAAWSRTANGLQLELSARQPLRASDEIEFAFTIRDAATRQPVADLEPYLGAWAHFVLLDRPLRNFLHAHPYDETTAAATMSAHCARMAAGAPPPREIRFRAHFPEPGRYKLWAQFQRNGEVIVMPFVFDVAEKATRRKRMKETGASK